ncbi:hypothetical protein SO802_022163, partial [Lithocarpus litseifolius]
MCEGKRRRVAQNCAYSKSLSPLKTDKRVVVHIGPRQIRVKKKKQKRKVIFSSRVANDQNSRATHQIREVEDIFGQ